MSDRSIGFVPLGAGLSAALVAIYALCALVAVAMPGFDASHGWLALFGGALPLTIAAVIRAIVANIVVAWIIAGVFALVHNAVVERRARRTTIR